MHRVTDTPSGTRCFGVPNPTLWTNGTMGCLMHKVVRTFWAILDKRQLSCEQTTFCGVDGTMGRRFVRE